MSKKNQLAVQPSGPPTAAEIEDINGHNRSAQGYAAEAVRNQDLACHHAVVAGLRLRALKARTPHGEWEAHFPDGRTKKANATPCGIFDFSRQTAQRYIDASESALARPGLAASIRKRIEAMAHRPPGAELTEDDHADLLKAVRGDTQRQLCLELRATRASAAEAGTGGGWMGGPKDQGGKDPVIGKEMSELLYEEFSHATNAITRLLQRGEFQFLEAEHARRLADIWTSWAEEARKQVQRDARHTR